MRLRRLCILTLASQLSLQAWKVDTELGIANTDYELRVSYCSRHTKFNLHAHNKQPMRRNTTSRTITTYGIIDSSYRKGRVSKML